MVTSKKADFYRLTKCTVCRLSAERVVLGLRYGQWEGEDDSFFLALGLTRWQAKQLAEELLQALEDDGAAGEESDASAKRSKKDTFH